MTCKDAYDNFILSKKLADLTEKSICNYTQCIFPLVQFIGLNTDCTDITQATINSYLGMIVDKTISKTSKCTYIRHIKIFLKWLSDFVKVNYDYRLIKIPKTPKKQVKMYSDEEVRKIFDCVDCESEWLTYRNKCIIALMYDSGLRQSEVASLQRSKISFSEHKLTVSGKGNKERVLPLGSISQHFMQKYFDMCPYTSKFAFVNRRGENLTCNAIKLLISKMSKELGFEFSSHKLRHNFATNYCLNQYENKGHIDIYRLMILLGHSEVETTRRYLHIANEIISSRECISQLDKIGIWEN